MTTPRSKSDDENSLSASTRDQSQRVGSDVVASRPTKSVGARARSLAVDHDILEAAARFRGALDGVDQAIWASVTISAFPRGACGHAAEMLGVYLRDTLGIEAEYVLKDFYAADGEWTGGHAWLEWDGLIIDITGDQFDWPAVIVTRTSPLHDGVHPNLRQSLNTDLRWWGRYCAPVYTAARRQLASGALDSDR